jgi:hypothetical protein
MRPAPPMARLPRCTRCHSLAKPSMEEYSHMGETVIRLGRVRLRSLRGAKRWSVGWVTALRCS